MTPDITKALLQAVLDHPHDAQRIVAWARVNGEALADMASGKGDVAESAPPRPGLVLVEHVDRDGVSRHRWVRPEEAKAHEEAKKQPQQSQQDHNAVVDAWLDHQQNANVSPERKALIGKAFKAALGGMPEPMRQRAIASLKSPPQIYESQQALTEALRAFDDVEPNEVVAGFFLHNQGTIHVDHGSGEEGEFSDHDDAVDTIAHELAHAIDGTNYHISHSGEWREAYADEINLRGNPISAYARTNLQEGFAEYVRALVAWPEDAKRMFPKSYAVLRANGLV